MFKKFGLILIALIVLVGVAGVYLKSNLNSIVRNAVEKYGTAATQTSVKLANFQIVPLSGEASISGFSVGSPSGFHADKALYLGSISIKIDPSSIRGSGPIVINDISVEKPQIAYEINNNGENNLKTIARNAQTYANSLSGKSASPSQDTSQTEKPGRKIIIKNLTIHEGEIAITQALLEGKKLSATLPTIHLTNIGKSEGGATPAEVADQLLTVITQTASKIATADLTKELGGNLKEKANGLLNGAGDAVGNGLNGLLGK